MPHRRPTGAGLPSARRGRRARATSRRNSVVHLIGPLTPSRAHACQCASAMCRCDQPCVPRTCPRHLAVADQSFVPLTLTQSCRTPRPTWKETSMYRHRRARLLVAGAATVALGALSASLLSSPAQAIPIPTVFTATHVPTANTRADGVTSPSVLSPELTQIVHAQGSTRLENGIPAVPYYGYDGNGPL